MFDKLLNALAWLLRRHDAIWPVCLVCGRRIGKHDRAAVSRWGQTHVECQPVVRPMRRVRLGSVVRT